MGVGGISVVGDIKVSGFGMWARLEAEAKSNPVTGTLNHEFVTYIRRGGIKFTPSADYKMESIFSG